VREELVWLDEESPRRGGALQASLEFVGALGLLLFASLRGILQARIELRETLHQMAFIGAASAPIVALTSAFTGAVVTLYSASLLVDVGGGGFVGGAIALAMTRELAPILTGIMVTARCGSAIAAQLGTMKITEQIDALRALAVSPIQYLVIPARAGVAGDVPDAVHDCQRGGRAGRLGGRAGVRRLHQQFPAVHPPVDRAV
jgi:phospholipid/cholesterol/gamma-HCH transport system permease protein